MAIDTIHLTIQYFPLALRNQISVQQEGSLLHKKLILSASTQAVSFFDLDSEGQKSFI